MSEEQKERERLFVEDYKDLCRKHNLQLVSEDPYCGLEIIPSNGKINLDWEYDL